MAETNDIWKEIFSHEEIRKSPPPEVAAGTEESHLVPRPANIPEWLDEAMNQMSHFVDVEKLRKEMKTKNKASYLYPSRETVHVKWEGNTPILILPFSFEGQEGRGIDVYYYDLVNRKWVEANRE